MKTNEQTCECCNRSTLKVYIKNYNGDLLCPRCFKDRILNNKHVKIQK